MQEFKHLVARVSSLPFNNNNNNNNSELYLHDYNNTALQKRRKRHNYSNLTIRVQFQLWYICHNIHPIFQ